jgi:hypothetical protein
MRTRSIELAMVVAVAAAMPVTLLACSGDDAGPSQDAFCDAYTAIDNSDFANSDTEDPAEIERIVGDARPLFDTLRSSAPPEIATDAAEVADGFTSFASLLDSVGYDLAQLDAAATPEQIAATTTLFEATTPSSAIGTYVEANCGIDLEEPTDQFSSISDGL